MQHGASYRHSLIVLVSCPVNACSSWLHSNLRWTHPLSLGRFWPNSEGHLRIDGINNAVCHWAVASHIFPHHTISLCLSISPVSEVLIWNDHIIWWIKGTGVEQHSGAVLTWPLCLCSVFPALSPTRTLWQLAACTLRPSSLPDTLWATWSTSWMAKRSALPPASSPATWFSSQDVVSDTEKRIHTCNHRSTGK